MTEMCDHEKYHPVGWALARGLARGLGSPPSTFKASNNLVLTLKQELRAQKLLSEDLQSSLAQVRKSVRATRLQECEIQNKVFEEQLERYGEERLRLVAAVAEAQHHSQECLNLEAKLIQRDQELAATRQQLRQAQKAQAGLQLQIRELARDYQEQIRALKDQLHAKEGRTASRPEDAAARESRIAELEAQVARLMKPHPHQVARVLEFLNLRLRAHHIDPSELGECLTPRALVAAQSVKRAVVLDLLAAEPFQLLLKAERLALCQYLFEDAQECPAALVLERFARGLGPYSVDLIEEEDQLFLEICQLVRNKAEQLNIGLLEFCNGEGTIAKESLAQVLTAFGFSPRQQLFLMTQLSLDSVGLDRLSYYPIFDLFGQADLRGSINPVEELSEEYDPSNSNTNLRRPGTDGLTSLEPEEAPTGSLPGPP